MKNEGKELLKPDVVQPMSTIFDLAKWFDDFPRRSLISSLATPSIMTETVVPAVDIYEEGNDYILKAELPGFQTCVRTSAFFIEIFFLIIFVSIFESIQFLPKKESAKTC
jgi:hypothetical protein